MCRFVDEARCILHLECALRCFLCATRWMSHSFGNTSCVGGQFILINLLCGRHLIHDSS